MVYQVDPSLRRHSCYQDVVVAGNLGRGIAIHYGTTAEPLTAPVILSGGAGDIRPNAVRIADVDFDGILDIVSLVQLGAATTPFVYWYKGNGEGTFQAASQLISSGLACTDGRSIEVRDLDGDSKPEVAVLCYNTNSIFIIRKHTDGLWKAANTQITGFTNPIAFTFNHFTPGDACAAGADYTGKPCIDIVVSQLSVASSIRMVRNFTVGAPSGGGTFNINQTSFSSPITAYGYAADLESVDVDGDGHVDVVVSMFNQNSMLSATSSGQVVYVLHGNGTGNFSQMNGWGMEGRGGAGLSVFDYDKNGYPDIVVSYRQTYTPYRVLSRWFNYTQ